MIIRECLIEVTRVENIVIQFHKSNSDIPRFQFCYEITIEMHLGTFFKLKIFEIFFSYIGSQVTNVIQKILGSTQDSKN